MFLVGFFVGVAFRMYAEVVGYIWRTRKEPWFVEAKYRPPYE
jgi:hypothetical protein